MCEEICVLSIVYVVFYDITNCFKMETRGLCVVVVDKQIQKTQIEELQTPLSERYAIFTQKSHHRRDGGDWWWWQGNGEEQSGSGAAGRWQAGLRAV